MKRITSITLFAILLLLAAYFPSHAGVAVIGDNNLLCSGLSQGSGMVDITVADPPSGPIPNFTAGLIGVMDYGPGGLSSGIDWMYSDYIDFLGMNSTTLTPTNSTGSQVAGWWSQKDARNTYLQLTNADSAAVTVHVRIFDDSCTEIRDFCDTYTGFDTYEYNFGDLFSNGGADIADANLQNEEGMVVITAVNNCGTMDEAAKDHNFLSASVSITDTNLDNAMAGYNMYARQAVCFTIPDSILVNEVDNGSFQDGMFGAMNWNVLMGNAGVIDSMGISPNVTPPMSQLPDSDNPDSDMFMAYAASSGNNGVQTGPYGYEKFVFIDSATPPTLTPLAGFPYPTLANGDLLNLGNLNSNQAVVESNPFTTSGADTVTYDFRLLAQRNIQGLECGSYGAVVLIDTSVPEFVDAECYNETGDGFITINQVSGATNVPCSANTVSASSYQIGAFVFTRGISDLVQGSLSVPGAGTYTVQFITGQEAYRNCTDPNRDMGSLFDNFSITSLQDDVCTGDLTGAENAFLDEIYPSEIWGLFDTNNSAAGSDVIVLNYADDYGPPYAPIAASSAIEVNLYDVQENDQLCGDALACFTRLGINDTLVASQDYSPRILTVNKSGSGTVTSDLPGIDCGSGCDSDTAGYQDGTVVTLTATPDEGSVFNTWGGACSADGSNTTAQVTMSSALTCTADFGILQRTLDIVKAGTGTGTVTSSPAGIDCGGDCTEDYDDGTVVTLTPTPDEDSEFGGWTGTGCVSGTVTMDDDRTCTATFNPKPTLTVTKAGTGDGTVTSNPAGIDCGSTCSDQFSTGTIITLTPTPDGNSDFAGWTGDADCSDGSVTLNASITCTATFNPKPTLTITKAGTGEGAVTSNPAGIDCGGSCSAQFSATTVVALTPTPAAGSFFAGWSGDADCSDGNVTLNADTACTATFNLIPQFNLIISKNGTGGGTVTSNPAGINCGSDCSSLYNENTLVNLTAIPDVGSVFAGWSGDADCSDGNVTMSGARNCTASFNLEIVPSVTLLPLDPGRAGEQNTFTITGATPNGPVRIIYSFTEGADNADEICNGLVTGIVNPRSLTTITANSFGTATLTRNLPKSISGITFKIQAVDLTPCEASNVTTETIAPPVGPTPPVLSAMNPGSVGQNTLTSTGHTAGGQVSFIWGFNEGNANGNSICQGLQAGINNFKLLTSAQADQSGNVTINVNVPAAAAGATIKLQSVDTAACSPSNVTTESF